MEVYREDPEEQPVEYVDVVIEAGEVGGPQTTRSELAVHVLRDLDYGDQVSVHGTASEHVFQAGSGQEPMRTRRVQAESVVALNVVEFDRPRLVAMGTSPGETFSLQDKHARHAYTVEDPQAPLCPRGLFGQEGQVRPVTSRGRWRRRCGPRRCISARTPWPSGAWSRVSSRRRRCRCVPP
ncbi:hypothetical protein E4A41_02045, partial [Micrococcus endophyticus]